MRRRLSILAALALAALGLAAAGALNGPLARTRVAAGLTRATPLENASPLATFTTVVLGGFRGIIADVLWLRASYLQDQGQYFEVVQLADWITALEPRCGEIWAFHAWNMAYNISAMMTSPEDRWRWVTNGIRLLRDEGLAWNPGDSDLYWELGWLFENKIGGPYDEAGGFYRRELAGQMTAVLGGGRPDYAALGPASEAGRRLRRELKLDPALMRRVDAEFGPLDWRLPEPHAVYWATRGLLTRQARNAAACDRMVYQSMAALFKQGTLTFDAARGEYRTAPCVALYPRVRKAYERALARDSADSMKTAYAYFLKDAVRQFHGLGQDDRARDAYATLLARFPADAGREGFDAFVRGKAGSPGARDPGDMP